LYQFFLYYEFEDCEMLDNDFRATELDPNLLATPFKVQTNWHVITGAPCSGKSTLIDQLADNGFQTAPEAARQYFEREMATTGRTIEEIREDVVPFLHGIMGMILEIERGLVANELVCLDRGYPDILAFLRQLGLDPNEYLPDCFHHRYASVFGSTGSQFSWTASGSKMRPMLTTSMSGTTAITLPWDIVL
jgi:hypothetical protein